MLFGKIILYQFTGDMLKEYILTKKVNTELANSKSSMVTHSRKTCSRSLIIHDPKKGSFSTLMTLLWVYFLFKKKNIAPKNNILGQKSLLSGIK